MLVPATLFIGFLFKGGIAALCPETWIDGTAVGLGCLLLDGRQDLTWDEANNFCQFTNNATLLEILTEEQLVFTQLQLTRLSEEEEEGGRNWWSSGTDVGRNGVWMLFFISLAKLYWSGLAVGDQLQPCPRFCLDPRLAFYIFHILDPRLAFYISIFWIPG